MATRSHPLRRDPGPFHLTHLEAGRSGAGLVWGEMGGTRSGHYPHLPPGGPGRHKGAEKAAHLAAGLRAAGRRAPAAGEGGGLGGCASRRAALLHRGSFLARKGVIVCSYFWYVRRAGRPKAEGTPLTGAPGHGRRPGGQRLEGCGRGGAVPRGGAAVWAGSAGAGAWPWPRPPGGRWHPLAQTV